MNIKGAIFDLDGTLLDSMFIWDAIGETYLRSRGIEPHHNLREILKPKNLHQAACYYRSEYGLTEDTEVIVSQVNSMLLRVYSEELLPKPGVSSFLASLKQRGVRMCIATATDHHLAKAALERTNLLGYFDAIFTCRMVGCGKDKPDIYDTAHAFLQTPKENTLIFEDAFHAIQTAKIAGYPVMGVYDPFAGHEAEIQRMEDWYIRSFHELEAIFHENDSYHSGF